MLRPGQAVALCALALLTIGVVMVNSAGMSVDPKEPLTIDGILLSKSTVYAGLAVLAMAIGAFFPIRRLLPSGLRSSRLASAPDDVTAIDARLFSPHWFSTIFREYIKLWPLWLGVLGLVTILILVYVPGIERPRNGSHRWITLHLPGLDSIQPSELAKWGVLALVAWYGARHARRMKSFWLGLAPALAAVGLVAGVIVLEDLGTGALVAAAAGVMLLAAGCRFWHMLVLMPVPLALGVLAIVTNEYRMHRIESFLNPYLEPQGKGFHMIQSMSAVAGGQIFGRGLGHGLQKFGYLPEDTTDFLFAIVCEELGVAGAGIVLFLLGSLIWAVWIVTRRETNPLLKLLGVGVMATIGIQAVINLAVVTGLGPTKGIALPLLSSGGTGWILTAAALGLIISMDRRPSDIAIEDDDEAPRTAPSVQMLGAMAVSAVAAPAFAQTSHDTGADPSAHTAMPETVRQESPEDATDATSESDADLLSDDAIIEEPAAIQPPAEPDPPAPAKPVKPTSRRHSDQTGLLFGDLSEPPATTPDVVITDSAREWLDENDRAEKREV